MAQAIMDPEKVRRFAEELQRFNTEIENRMVLLHARFTALGDTLLTGPTGNNLRDLRILLSA